MFHDTATTIARLEALRDLGVRIAIDDFGTGYSSLGYLRRFPVDVLKIAREFIGRPPTSDSEDWAFAGAIVALGRTLDLRIIAEGIEEPGQLDRLRDARLRVRPGLPVRPPDVGAVDRRAVLPGRTADRAGTRALARRPRRRPGEPARRGSPVPRVPARRGRTPADVQASREA